MAAAIEIKNLTKQYPVPRKGEVVNAVDDLTLTVEEGEIFGFLGANGAGKTTTIKILLGLIYPTVGEANVLGQPAGDNETKHKIAYLPESPYFYEHLTAVEIVTFYAQLFGMSTDQARAKAEELVDFVGLNSKSDRDKRVAEFSKGMRQRVGIAQSLINDPTLLFYDEPTSGLDAIARRDIRDLMLELKRRGKTMFLSSHQLEDVEMVCHRVSIIHKGKLRVLGTVDDLLAGERVELTATDITPAVAAKIQSAAPNTVLAGEKIVALEDAEAIGPLLDLIRGGGGRVISVIPKRRSLEDLFVEVVGERIDAATGSVTTTIGSGQGDGETLRRVSANKYKELSDK
jgi:ABC-2 type transport system ATP-binding protein